MSNTQARGSKAVLQYLHSYTEKMNKKIHDLRNDIWELKRDVFHPIEKQVAEEVCEFIRILLGETRDRLTYRASYSEFNAIGSICVTVEYSYNRKIPKEVFDKTKRRDLNFDIPLEVFDGELHIKYEKMIEHIKVKQKSENPLGFAVIDVDKAEKIFGKKPQGQNQKVSVGFNVEGDLRSVDSVTCKLAFVGEAGHA